MASSQPHRHPSERALWEGMHGVISGPLADIATRLSHFLMPRWQHEALIIFTRECTGRPRKVAGSSHIVDRITVAELCAVRDSVLHGGVIDGEVTLGGALRTVWGIRDITDTLFLVAHRGGRFEAPDIAVISGICAIVAASIRQQVVQASPDYLAESRAASSERSRTIAELTEVHEGTLSSILGTLRSTDLDDRRARITACETASAALIALRRAGAADRDLAEEAVTTAFARLQGELCPLLRDSGVYVDYADPPADGRPLPGEVAHAARALVRSTVMALVAQAELRRLRIAWDCDGENVLIEVRDQGEGSLDRNALMLQIDGRLRTLRGEIEIESVAGWGNRVYLSLPLDPPARRPDEHLLSTLNAREVEVLGYLANGMRNRGIAERMGISPSTVKFHVGRILRKLEVENRSQAGAVAGRAGILPLGTPDA